MNKNLTFFSLLILCLFVFGSCTEDGDVVNPTVVISSPSNGDAFSISDEIELVGRATDDVSLKNVTITSALGINETITDIADPMDFPFNFTLTLDPNTSAGEYELVIKAVDSSDNEAEASVNITIQ